MPRVVVHRGQHPLLVVAEKSHDGERRISSEPKDLLDTTLGHWSPVYVVAKEQERVLAFQLRNYDPEQTLERGQIPVNVADCDRSHGRSCRDEAFEREDLVVGAKSSGHGLTR